MEGGREWRGAEWLNSWPGLGHRGCLNGWLTGWTRLELNGPGRGHSSCRPDCLSARLALLNVWIKLLGPHRLHQWHKET